MLSCLHSVQISLNIQYGFEQHGLTDHVQTVDIYKVSSVKSQVISIGISGPGTYSQVGKLT